MDFLDPHPIHNIGKRKIKFKSRETIEPQEVLLDNLARRKEEESGISEKKLEVPLSAKILRVFYYSSICIILFLFANTFYLNVIHGKSFSQLSKNNSQRTVFIRAERGVIYDKNMEQLVSNLPSFDLVLDKRDLPEIEVDRDKVIKGVANIIKINEEDLQKEIREANSVEILILENIPHETLVLLEAKISDFIGFRIEKNTIRSYTNGSVFSHLIGYTGKINEKELATLEDYSISDYLGKTGLERFYEKYLKGIPGKILTQKDVVGNKISESSPTEPEPGNSLVLYLDAKLQEKATEALLNTMKNVNSKAGSVVAMDPKTGGILAMVSEPSFDNNLFSQGISNKDLQSLFNNPQKPLFNRVVSGGYVTGSTIKPLEGAAALQEGIIKENTTVNCKGEIIVPNPYNPDLSQHFTDLHVHGITDVKKAIAESCNVFFYTISGGFGSQKGLGVELIKKYLNLFGWGSPTNIDFPDDISGRVPNPAWKKEYFSNNKLEQNWVLGDTYNLSIGQGYLSVSPLQVVTAFASIANGGKLFEPHIVQKIIDSDKNTIQETEPKVVREGFISSENLAIIREGMRDAVVYGSSASLNSLPVKVASKTGTAQTPKSNVFHNWVTVFAPYDDPQIVITVQLENVPGLQAAALPVVKSILQWYFTQD